MEWKCNIKKYLIYSENNCRGAFVTQELCGRRHRFVENARKTQYYFEMMKVAEIGCAIYSMIGLIFSIMGVRLKKKKKSHLILY